MILELPKRDEVFVLLLLLLLRPRDLPVHRTPQQGYGGLVMVKPRELTVSVLALAVHVAAFQCPPTHTKIDVIQNHGDSSCSRSRCTRDDIKQRSGCRSGRVSTAVMMVSEREEELKAKISKLRGAAAKGDSYERVVGKGKDLTKKMEKTKGEFEGSIEKAQQASFVLTWHVQFRVGRQLLLLPLRRRCHNCGRNCFGIAGSRGSVVALWWC